MHAEDSGNCRFSAAHLVLFVMSVIFPRIALPQPSIPSLVFSVAPNDQTLFYPRSLRIIADEHTTVMPVRRVRAPWASGSAGQPGYLVFTAGNNDNLQYSGTFVLESRDLIHFDFAPDYGNPMVHGHAAMWPPNGFSDCQYSGDTVFDQNYAAPGSVVQDPTRPLGHLIMIYEAERHCPTGSGGKPQFDFWASVGLALSADAGKTWPKPGQYGAKRYAVLTIAGTEPRMNHPSYGDALPSAFVDDVKRRCDDEHRKECAPREYYLYAVYYFTGSPTHKSDGFLRIARAKLGGEGRLKFKKWYVDPITKIGGWTQDGIDGLDSGFTPTKGCAMPSYQLDGQISYIDALRIYVLTFVCVNMQQRSDGTYAHVKAGWYYSTATSLETLSPDCPPGHLGLSGNVFFLNGNSIGVAHEFASRSFKIDVGGPQQAGCESADRDK